MTDTLSPELLARYADARMPRYTSYPTAPNFSVAVGEADYRSWLASLTPGPASLYVHIPFCRAMCWYCGCHTTVASREAPVARYLDSLTKEIGLVSRYVRGLRTISHLHFGGGTPTMMSPDQMRSIMGELRTRFSFESDAEVAIEIDPRTLSEEMAQALGERGFNRASLGVQSFDIHVQRAINRVQSFEQIQEAIRLLRANGMKRINFDLIYGLPKQSLQSCLDTVEQAVTLRPDRLAVFGYAHVPAFKPHQRKIHEAALPNSDARFTHSRAIADALVRAGYVEIGLDHFALPDDPLSQAAAKGRLHRNFQGYTTDEAEVLIGLGASSIGRMPEGYVQNETRIPIYQRTVAEGRLPIARGYRFEGEDRLRGAVIERLMCDNRVDVAEVCRGFDTDPKWLLQSARLEPLIADGLVERDGAEIAVKPHARPLVRSIAAAFDAHLAPSADRYSRAV
ncbi:oxygen-independent coproporphyrinogen III oxidase [Sphingomonas sediminicola]|uniref:oxygen-independent coproporphyrinogen III oxidase n=1 Tax=Sphingomonas sediminicola TaxID=386874 RepID=UPI001CA74F9F|nr:oxygen-independent coproporphyrinogen III oxidase [Sphingomonas sediminicola]